MKQLNEPDYGKAINNVAKAVGEVASQKRLENLLHVLDTYGLNEGDRELIWIEVRRLMAVPGMVK